MRQKYVKLELLSDRQELVQRTVKQKDIPT